MTRWAYDEPGRPPRIITEPLVPVPLDEPYTWGNEALVRAPERVENACLKCGGGPFVEYDSDCEHVTRESLREGLRGKVRVGWGGVGRYPFEDGYQADVGGIQAKHPTREGAIALVLDALVEREAELLRHPMHLGELGADGAFKVGDRVECTEGSFDRKGTVSRIELYDMVGVDWDGLTITMRRPVKELRLIDESAVRFRVGDVVEHSLVEGGRQDLTAQVEDPDPGGKGRYVLMIGGTSVPTSWVRHATVGVPGVEPFKAGDVVVRIPGGGVYHVVGVRGCYLDLRGDAGTPRGRPSKFYRHATDEERATYEAPGDEDRCPECHLAGGHDVKCPRRRPSDAGGQPPESIIVGGEIIQWADVERTSGGETLADDFTLHLKDGRTLTVGPADIKRMAGL